MRGALPLLAVTLGDPHGVGPEVALKALTSLRVRRAARCVAVGRPEDLEAAACVCGIAVTLREVTAQAVGEWQDEAIAVVPAGQPPKGARAYGTVAAAAGQAALESIRAAVNMAMAGVVAGVVTAPINKEAVRLAGCPYPGHTELLAHLTGASTTRMMLVAKGLRVVHNSTHLSLRAACDAVTTERVLCTIRLAHRAAREMGIAEPRVGVAGLNPHAGESGLFGLEEQEQIAPAVAAARVDGIDAVGPVPPDTIFAQARAGAYHVVVAMYHDQGHIPVKTLGFEPARGAGEGGRRWSAVAGVNVTLGLPIIRTSVDHGTAFDIAGRGVARADSMVDAILLAAAMARRRKAALP